MAAIRQHSKMTSYTNYENYLGNPLDEIQDYMDSKKFLTLDLESQVAHKLAFEKIYYSSIGANYCDLSNDSFDTHRAIIENFINVKEKTERIIQKIKIIGICNWHMAIEKEGNIFTRTKPSRKIELILNIEKIIGNHFVLLNPTLDNFSFSSICIQEQGENYDISFSKLEKIIEYHPNPDSPDFKKVIMDLCDYEINETHLSFYSRAHPGQRIQFMQGLENIARIKIEKKSQISFNAIRFLSRLSKIEITAAFRRIDFTDFSEMKSKNGDQIQIKNLNKDAIRRSRKDKGYRLSLLPAEVQWKTLMGSEYVKPSHITGLLGFKTSLYKRIFQELGYGERVNEKNGTISFNFVEGELTPLFRLVRLFGDYCTIRNWVTKRHGFEWSSKGVHDAGQFDLPGIDEEWDHSGWAALVLKSPRVIKYSNMFATLENQNQRKVCASFEALKRQILLQGRIKIKGPVQEKCAQICLDNDLDQEILKSLIAATAKNQPKSYEQIPFVLVKAEQLGLPSDWEFSKLQHDDITGLILGKLSGCCQSIGGAGEDSAIAGYTESTSGFYVVRKKGRIIAQIWAWRSQDDDIVLDSIESLSREPEVLKIIAKLIFEGAKRIAQSGLGIKSCMIGDTGSGITREVGSRMKFNKRNYSRKPMSPKGYFDGRSQCLLAGEPAKAPKAPKSTSARKRVTAILESIATA